MTAIRRVVVAVLLAVWSFPAVSLAKPEPPGIPAAAAGGVPATRAANAGSGEAASLAEREKQSQDLQDYKGGAVAIYFGSGAALVLLIILLIILI
jgi:hypothetical protein